jgi:formylglycine-generating enzyme required for sulfatase activity/tRNA A-37 threonylcarbamoyl transferase component Bud32
MSVAHQTKTPAAGGGRYSEWRILGKGGTANVYRVRDNELDYDVAIKILKPEILTSAVNLELMKQSLRTEVLISRRLRHQNICAIHDLYDGPEGFGTVMDLIEGVELRDWMNDHLNDLLDTAPQRLDLLRKVAEALAYAHTLIVHRDLKPQNIFLSGGDIRKPVIMDFGFSVIGDKTDSSTMQAFTPKYMAPEQYEAPDKVDRRADLFALGILAYELFAGRVPVHSLKDILKTRKPPRVPLHEVPPPSDFNAAVRPAFDRVILQLTAYEPERRIQSADELVTLLAKPDTLLYPSDYRDPSEGQATGTRVMSAVELPGGEYFLGGRAGGKGTNGNELPTRRITLTPFLIDRYPVTNREYLEYAESTGRRKPPLHEHPAFGAPNHPVVGVTFDEAAQFARWAGGMLPSEAQWEYAARAGQKLIEYPWGDEPPTVARANINNVSRTTSIVGAYPEGSNQFEIYDLCGNVWEWCLDVYEEKFYTNIQPGTVNPVNDPKNVPAKALRVLRGGSFQSFSVQGRCAFRFYAPPIESRNDIGFRLVYRQQL